MKYSTEIDHCTSLENLFFLNCAVGDLTKVRMAKSAREGPFCHLTLDVMRLCSRTFRKKMDLCISLRESKQKLGLENFQVEDWQKLINHVGFVCLAYSMLTILRQEFGGSVGSIKFKLQDEVYGISRSADIFEQKLAS